MGHLLWAKTWLLGVYQSRPSVTDGKITLKKKSALAVVGKKYKDLRRFNFCEKDLINSFTCCFEVRSLSISTPKHLVYFAGEKAGGIQVGSRQSHLRSPVGLPGSRHHWRDPAFPTWGPTWDPTSHPGSKVGSRLPPGILGGIPPLTWDPRRDPASPAQGPTWDPAFHPGSKVNAASHLQSKAGSHLSHLGSIPGIQGVIPPPTRDPRVELETRVYNNHNEQNGI